MVGHANSTTGIVHADMTLTQAKVKVTGLLNFRKLVRPCMLAAMTVSPLAGLFGLALQRSTALSGRGARVYTCTCVHDSVYRVDVYRSRLIGTSLLRNVLLTEVGVVDGLQQ